MGRPLKIAKAQAVLTITDTAATGSIVTVSGGNLTTTPTVGITKGMSFVAATTVGAVVRLSDTVTTPVAAVSVIVKTA